MMKRDILCLILLPFLVAPGLLAQPTPVDNEFQVNTYTTGSQTRPDVATDPDGNFIVVWQSGSGVESGPDGDAAGVRGQRYTSDGTAQGSEFAINAYTTNSQAEPAVGTDALGNFIVVWQSGSPGPDGDGSGIQARRFNSDGTGISGEFQINTTTTGFQILPDVAVTDSGDFFVVWEDDFYIRGRHFASDETPLSGEILVDDGSVPRVATTAGGFVVVWTAFTAGNYAQRFASDGTPLGDQLLVSPFFETSVPAVASDSVGDFVVVWNNFYAGTMEGRRLASDGSFLGGEFQLNSATSSTGAPDVSSDAAGNFLAVWRRSASGDESIRGQRVASNGTFLGGEFQVNTTTGTSLNPAVASTPAGELVAVWTGPEILAQRFSPDTSADVAISKDDGVERVLPGAQVIYTIIAENLGPSFADPVTVNDAFPPELTCSWTSVAAGGASGNTNGSGDIGENLSLPAGSSVTYTATCDVAVDATGTLTNTATISSLLPDPVPSNNSATDNDTRLRIADLSLTLSDTPDPAVIDSPLTYTVQVVNAGPEPAEDVRATLILPPEAVFIEATGAGWVCNGSRGIVICGLSVLGVGAASPLMVMVTTPSSESVLTHQVLVSAVELDPHPEDNLATELTVVTPTLIFLDRFESGNVSKWPVSSP